MKSVKLSKMLREDIVKSMTDAWVTNNKLSFDIKEEENKVAESIWNSNYGHLNFRNIPDAMLRFDTSVKIDVNSNVSSFSLLKEKPIPKNGNYGVCVIKTYNKTPKIIEKFLKLREQHTDWLEIKRDFISEIIEITNSVNTTKQLVELWPEAKQYLPAFANDPSKGINLPALKTSRLNSALGIKP